MVRRQCQVKRIARGVGRHDVVIDIRLYYLSGTNILDTNKTLWHKALCRVGMEFELN